MKLKTVFLFLLTISSFAVKSQMMDTALAKKVTVSGFCLCKTSLPELQNLNINLKGIEVEEMDLPKNCYGQDGRFENGKGYYSDKFPGIIFQKDQTSDYIGKIRLTKDFAGNLPDGTPINLKKLTLIDVFKIYPELKEKWGSRGCSNYWSFSNDTIAFFVKIDKAKTPQFPIDEAYYFNKPIEGIDIRISCYSIYNKSNDLILFPPEDPMYFLDSIRVNSGVLKLYEPTEIATVSVYKGEQAIKLAGNDAKNGAIYITTKSFARNHYWTYFKSKSDQYQKAVPTINSESQVVYILNGKVLESNFEGDLFSINDSNFIELIVIDENKLKKDYNISNKPLGVIIRTIVK